MSSPLASPAPEPADTPAPLSNAKEWQVIFVMMFVAIASTGSSAIIYAATPMFIKVFPDPKIIGWMSSIYFLVGAVTAGLCGGIADLYGRRATLIWMFIIAGLAGVLAGAASDPIYAVGFHAVQGIAVAAHAINIGILREHISGKRLPMAIALMTTATTATAGLFFMLAGYIMDHQSWRFIFWFGPCILLPAIAAMFFLVPASKSTNQPRRLPMLNGALFGLAALGIMLGIGEGGQNGFLTVRALGYLFFGMVFTFAWVRHSLRSPTPMVDVRLLKQKGLAAIIIAYGLLAVSMMQYGHVLLFIGQAETLAGLGAGLSATAIAAAMAPQGLLSIVTGPASGLAVQRFGHYRVFLTSLCLISLPFILLMVIPHNLISLIGIIIVGGIVSGALMPSFRIALQEEVDAGHASSAMGIAELVRAMCMGLGAQITATALVGHGHVGESTAPIIEPVRFYSLMTGFVIAIVLAAGIYAWFGSRRGKVIKEAAEVNE